jgi:hypothetical protein
MALIAIAAGKGAPGVTTAVVSLGAVWPRQVLVAECDPAGADLAYRLEAEGHTALAQDRGVLSLAASLRTGARAVDVWDHAQRIAGGLPVLVGPASSGQAAALAGSWAPIADALCALANTDVLADCGRLSAGGAALELLARADYTVLVARAAVDGVAHLRHAVEMAMAATNGSVGVVAVGDPSRDQGQVQEVLDASGLPARVLGVLAQDPAGAAGLRGEWTRRLDRTALVVSARAVAYALDGAALAVAAARPATEPAGAVS